MTGPAVAEVLSFEWVILLLRVAFIGLLYVFLYQVIRVTSRELVMLARQSAPDVTVAAPPRLIVVDGAASGLAAGTAFVIGPVTTVGRRDGHDITLDDQFISGDHAELRHRGTQWWLVDLASTNGTFINGEPVTGQAGIRAGDIVQFGRIKLRFSQ